MKKTDKTVVAKKIVNLEKDIQSLQKKVDELRHEKDDLVLLLETATEHSDRIEEELLTSLDTLKTEKEDLELILDTATKHSDYLEEDLIQKVDLTIQESEAQFHLISKIIPVPILICKQSDHQIIFANPSARTMLRYSDNDLNNLNITDFYNDEQRLQLEKAFEEKKIDNLEISGKRADGSDFYALSFLQAIKFHDTPCFVNILYDVTKLKIAEQAQKDAEREKRSSLEVMVAGVAHEINTPVGTSIMAVSYLNDKAETIHKNFTENRLKKSDFVRFITDTIESTKSVLNTLTRAADLISSFKQVTADQSYDLPRRFKVSEYLNDILATMRNKLKKTSHTINLNCSEELQIKSYPGALYQIISNLLINSVTHAFKKNQAGEITFDISVSDELVTLTYSDDGVGMEKEVCRKIFDPFFTTNRSNGGTGLGMYIVYNLISQKLNGHIVCDSSPGKGTSFTITIPDLK